MVNVFAKVEKSERNTKYGEEKSTEGQKYDTVDDTGLPTSTAGGNKGDIECYEQQNGILVEVTMAVGRTQTMMEVWPIERHLIDFQKQQKSQCIFIAPSIYSDSERQIQFIAYTSKRENIIRPFTIEDLISYLERSHLLFDYSYRSEADEEMDRLQTTLLAADPPQI